MPEPERHGHDAPLELAAVQTVSAVDRWSDDVVESLPGNRHRILSGSADDGACGRIDEFGGGVIADAAARSDHGANGCTGCGLGRSLKRQVPLRNGAVGECIFAGSTCGTGW